MPVPSHDIFFDPTGRRWRRVKGWTLLVVAFLATLLVGSWTQARKPPTLDGQDPMPSWPNLAGLGQPEEIGNGPLVRLVRVERRPPGAPVAVDVLTNRTLGALSPSDVDAVGDDRYAIYRYGYSQSAHKTIQLTFDDGPDPVWTPQILDVLSRNHAPATFFVVGSETVMHPELVARETREGHAVGNHTMTHPALTATTVRQELVPTDRIIRATTDTRTNLFRMPYDGSGPSGAGNIGQVLVEAQRLKYITSMEDFDPQDWTYGDRTMAPPTPMPLPPTTMDNITVLLHDGGGNRAATVAYLERLIPWAKAHGYSFHTLPQVSPEAAAGLSHQSPAVWDLQTLWAFQARWIWPKALLNSLFLLAVVYIVVIGAANILLAAGRRFRYRRSFGNLPTDFSGPPVTAVIPAYNEEKVIARSLEALCGSAYRGLVEVLVVDDGSRDTTANIVARMAEGDERIRLLRQPNSGKAVALNHAFMQARGEIVVTLDADTVFKPTTIGNLVRPFTNDPGERLGAVAGTVKVGNLSNLLTRWQALEYIVQIGVDRGAQDVLHAIMVVPGACAAWRRDAVLSAGGYASSTLAEDCDLALELQHQGYAVVQSAMADCYTEAPENFRALARQRFRWMYGNIQALWKHRFMILNPRYGWLGMMSMPLAVVSLLLPVVFLPFVYVMAALSLQDGGLRPILVFGGLFLCMQTVQAVAGVLLTRERRVHLLMVPVYRLIAEPLRAYLLYKSALTMLRGGRLAWNKLQRTGTVSVERPAEVRART